MTRRESDSRLVTNVPPPLLPQLRDLDLGRRRQVADNDERREDVADPDPGLQAAESGRIDHPLLLHLHETPSLDEREALGSLGAVGEHPPDEVIDVGRKPARHSTVGCVPGHAQPLTDDLYCVLVDLQTCRSRCLLLDHMRPGREESLGCGQHLPPS